MTTQTNKHNKTTPPVTDPAIIAVLFGWIAADLDEESAGMLDADGRKSCEIVTVASAGSDGSGGNFRSIRSEGLVVNIRDPNYGKKRDLVV